MAAQRKSKVVRAALEAKGMVCDENHHHMLRKEIKGVTTLVTRISHNSDEITRDIAKLMGSQCCLQIAEFWDLVDCPLTADAWDALVAERCVDGLNPLLGY